LRIDGSPDQQHPALVLNEDNGGDFGIGEMDVVAGRANPVQLIETHFVREGVTTARTEAGCIDHRRDLSQPTPNSMAEKMNSAIPTMKKYAGAASGGMARPCALASLLSRRPAVSVAEGKAAGSTLPPAPPCSPPGPVTVAASTTTVVL